MALTIAFHSNQMARTGTEVALYDYAHHAERLLGHRSVVLYRRDHPGNHPQAIERFAVRFDLHPYDDVARLDDVLAHAGAGMLYAIKAGRVDRVVSRRVPTLVHAVFPAAPWHAHGTVYAYVSQWLADHCAGGRLPFVPHMIDLPAEAAGNLRAELGLPAGCLVVGGHGGRRSFDVPCARARLQAALARLPQLHAVFMHIEPFIDHPRVHFLPGTTDPLRKLRFIDTCDAMLHARLQGESFGLACGEFSVRNRPVLAWAGSKHRHHLQVLGERALVYDSAEALLAHLLALPQRLAEPRDWDCYSARFDAQAVMQQFDEVFIHGALRARTLDAARRQRKLAASLAYLRNGVAASIRRRHRVR
jgi:hypothetical protein